MKKHMSNRLLRLSAIFAVTIFVLCARELVFAQEVRVPASQIRTGDAISKPLTMEDRTAIAELISSYSYNWDSGNADDLLALFAPDCIYQAYGPGGTKRLYSYTSKEEMGKSIKLKFEQLKKRSIQSRLYQTNMLMSLRADGKVDVTSMMLLVWQSPDKLTPSLQESGIIKDVIVRTIAGWKFTSHTLYVDHK